MRLTEHRVRLPDNYGSYQLLEWNVEPPPKRYSSIQSEVCDPRRPTIHFILGFLYLLKKLKYHAFHMYDLGAPKYSKSRKHLANQNCENKRGFCSYMCDFSVRSNWHFG